jgi:hypothetical protein
MAATAIGLDEPALLGSTCAVECVHGSPRYPPPGLPEEKNSVFSELAHEYLPAYLIPRELAANDRCCLVYGELVHVRRPGVRVGFGERKLIMRRVCAGRGKLHATGGAEDFEPASVPFRSPLGTGAPNVAVTKILRDRANSRFA